MLKIGDFSKLSRISVRMLRHYESMGLLKPLSVDSFSGYRYYAAEQLADANRITALRNMGFGLAETAELLSRYSDRSALAVFLEDKYKEVLEQRQEMNRRLMLIETTIERIRKDGDSMKYNVTVKTFGKRYVASVRKTIPSYANEGDLWHILKEEGKEIDLQLDTPCMAQAVFYDEGFKDTDVDVEIQANVKEKYSDTENIKFKTVPAVEAASTVYKGSYESITEAYAALAGWIDDNGYEICGNMFSIYHVNPGVTNNPEEYVTEVCCPVRKVR